jgi:hypothetical protein
MRSPRCGGEENRSPGDPEEAPGDASERPIRERAAASPADGDEMRSRFPRPRRERIRDGTGVPRLEENRPGAHSE